MNLQGVGSRNPFANRWKNVFSKGTGKTQQGFQQNTNKVIETLPTTIKMPKPPKPLNQKTEQKKTSSYLYGKGSLKQAGLVDVAAPAAAFSLAGLLSAQHLSKREGKKKAPDAYNAYEAAERAELEALNNRQELSSDDYISYLQKLEGLAAERKKARKQYIKFMKQQAGVPAFKYLLPITALSALGAGATSYGIGKLQGKY